MGQRLTVVLVVFLSTCDAVRGIFDGKREATLVPRPFVASVVEITCEIGIFSGRLVKAFHRTSNQLPSDQLGKDVINCGSHHVGDFDV